MLAITNELIVANKTKEVLQKEFNNYLSKEQDDSVDVSKQNILEREAKERAQVELDRHTQDSLTKNFSCTTFSSCRLRFHCIVDNRTALLNQIFCQP